MLKSYINRDNTFTGTALIVASTTESPVLRESLPPEDDVTIRSLHSQPARLPNSKALSDLPSRLEHLPSPQRQSLLALIASHPKLFGDIPTQTTAISHDIDVKNACPIKQHPYCVNSAKLALLKQVAEYLLTHGFARPSTSPWSSPCLVAMKPDGTPRFLTDYRKVNSVTTPDS